MTTHAAGVSGGNWSLANNPETTMAEETRNSWLLPSAGIVMLVSILTGGYFKAGTPESPKSSGGAASHAAEAPAAQGREVAEKVSRLWDDPLTTAEALEYIPFKGDMLQQWKNKEMPIGKVPATKPRDVPGAKSGNLKHVIFLLTPGHRYPDVAEWRRQQRYAVQAAMWSKGYKPSKPDALQYVDVSFEIAFGHDANTTTVKPGDDWYLRVPYEDFDNEKGAVRICYLNVDLLEGLPLYTIARIAEKVVPREVLQNGGISVATPPSTNWLNTILGEEEGEQRMDYPNVQIEVFNTNATGVTYYEKGLTHTSDGSPGSWAFAVKKPHEALLSLCPIFWAMGEAWPFFPGSLPVDFKVRVHQLIENDSESVKMIVGELGERQMEVLGNKAQWLWGKPCKVALLTEGETDFGEKFFEALANKIEGTSPDSRVLGKSILPLFLPPLPEQITASWVNQKDIVADPYDRRIFSYYYLRGISGLTPEGRSTREFIDRPSQRAVETGTPGEALSRAIEPAYLPPPFGASQFDYIARLGEDLLRQQKDMRLKGKGEIQSFVLIGTDVDDKLAMLKVLRPRFPSALFFTNDMDAEFLQPENRDITRNLLVFSRYGLDESAVVDNVRADLSGPGTLPSFRRSMQIATVDSIRAALDWQADNTWAGRRKVREVQMYEVGLQRAHLLPKPQWKPAATVPTEWPSPFMRRFAIVIASVISLLAFAFVPAVRALPSRLARKISKRWKKGNAQAGNPAVQPAVQPAKQRETKPEDIEAIFVNALKNGLDKSIMAPPTPEIKSPLLHSWPWLAVVAGIGGAAYVFLEKASMPVVWLFMLCTAIAAAWLLVVPRPEHRVKGGWIFASFAGVSTIAWWHSTTTAHTTAGLPDSSIADVLNAADGVSLLPAIVLRFLAAALAVWFLFKGYQHLRGLRSRLTYRFFLEEEGGLKGGIPVENNDRVAGENPVAGAFTGKGFVLREFPKRDELDQGTSPDDWHAPPRPTKGGEPENESWEWKRYLEDSHPLSGPALRRMARWLCVALLLAGVVMLLAGFPRANARGLAEKKWDGWTLGTSLLCLSVLCVFVGDQFRRCEIFIRGLYANANTTLGLELEEALQLIGSITGGVGNLLVQPFLVCVILLIAHSGIFEQWFGLGGLYGMLALALGALLFMAWRTQHTAQEIKSKAIDSLKLQLAESLWMKRLLLQRLDFRGNTTEKKSKSWWLYTVRRLARHQTMPEQPRTLQIAEAKPVDEIDRGSELCGARDADVTFQSARIERLTQLIEIVRDIREGAFGGLRENPIFRSILIPGLGLGGLQLIQRLMNG